MHSAAKTVKKKGLFLHILQNIWGYMSVHAIGIVHAYPHVTIAIGFLLIFVGLAVMASSKDSDLWLGVLIGMFVVLIGIGPLIVLWQSDAPPKVARHHVTGTPVAPAFAGQ